MPFTSEQHININTSLTNVWEAITDPILVQEYFFGIEVICDWKVGSPILYRGEWDGNSFEDKGIILEVEPEETLVHSYFSSFFGVEEKEENYQIVRYSLTPQNGGTLLVVHQENIPTESSMMDTQKNWKTVLQGLKEVAER